MGKASQTGGVKPMSIVGRLGSERERLLGMSPEERAWRKQWVKDQELCPEEPRKLPQMYRVTHNPIRRLYRFPLDQLAKALTPALGETKAYAVRYFTGKVCLAIAGIYAAAYYVKYNTSDWTRKGGLRIISSRLAVVEGDPGYPKLSDKSVGADYATRGFENMKQNL